ncbi:Uncharacterized protein YpmB [Gracilibacillus ureilyticus]|uniref:Uncharacterized protein YpmB n=1 Tax=Gracilibacillus ureilyticus TaxID=531814 RepID=A0A1H9LMY6_9BACI|nr:hypothetical protein [Gracilibacillus ureilyticus]SER12505.1 Uncharacterized protein YpmB [Gracilibacillus ureilyticus]
MRRLFSPFIELKKSIVISTIALILLGGVLLYCLHIYNQIMEDKTARYEAVEDYLMEQEPAIEQISRMDRYHGDLLYYVAEAEIQGKAVYIYITEEDGFQHEIYNKDELYSEEEILSEWKNSCTNCELIDSQIGMLNGYPALEITYSFEENLVYDHVILEDKSKYSLTINPSLK